MGVNPRSACLLHNDTTSRRLISSSIISHHITVTARLRSVVTWFCYFCHPPTSPPLLGLGKLESGYLHNTTRARQLAWSGDKQQPRRVKMHQNNKSVSDWRNISTSPSPPSTQYLPPTTLLLASSVCSDGRGKVESRISTPAPSNRAMMECSEQSLLQAAPPLPSTQQYPAPCQWIINKSGICPALAPGAAATRHPGPHSPGKIFTLKWKLHITLHYGGRGRGGAGHPSHHTVVTRPQAASHTHCRSAPLQTSFSVMLPRTEQWENRVWWVDRIVLNTWLSLSTTPWDLVYLLDFTSSGLVILCVE